MGFYWGGTQLGIVEWGLPFSPGPCLTYTEYTEEQAFSKISGFCMLFLTTGIMWQVIHQEQDSKFSNGKYSNIPRPFQSIMLQVLSATYVGNGWGWPLRVTKGASLNRK